MQYNIYYKIGSQELGPAASQGAQPEQKLNIGRVGIIHSGYGYFIRNDAIWARFSLDFSKNLSIAFSALINCIQAIDYELELNWSPWLRVEWS